ncbi:putative polyol transporter 3, partial [Pseudolycoriella hygida]
MNNNNRKSVSFTKTHHQTTVVYPRNSYTIERSYCEIVQKNKPQSNSVVGGMCLLFVGGLHLGWGIWRAEVREPWVSFNNLNIIIFIMMSWYMFALVGGIIGALLITKMRKKFIYYTGGTISTISSILFIVWYNNHIAIIVGRCLAGLTHGIIYHTTIIHAAENVVKEVRGMLLSTLNWLMYSGVFVSSILISSVTYGQVGAFNSDRILGMFGLSFSMLAILCTVFLTYESVPYLLVHGKDSEAVVNLLKLRNESVMSTKLTNDLDEMRLMVSQDRQESQNVFTNGNGSAMGRMIALRMLSTLTNNFLLNIIMIGLTIKILEPSYYHISAVILTGTRFTGSIVPIFTTDFFKRKVHLNASAVSSAIVILVLAIIMVSVSEFGTTTSWIPAALCVAFQLFASIGIDPIEHIYLSEAFSTSKKAWSIACVTAAENVLQMVLIGVFFIDRITYLTVVAILFTTAGLMFALVVILQFSIPETLNLTIKETRDLFRK